MKTMRGWGPLALLLAGCLAGFSGSRGDARAQGTYVPGLPEQDSLLYPEQKLDPRVAPHDAHNPVSRDPYVPKNEKQAWVNNDYFSIPIDTRAAFLIPIVENGHLGSKSNPRGFWPRYAEGQLELAVMELKYVLWVFPNHPRALHLLGQVARQMHQPTIPIAFYEKALRLFPDRAYTHAQYGAYLVEIGEKTQGIMQLEQALKQDPTSLPARAWLDKAKRALGMETGDNAPPTGMSASPLSTQQDGMYVPRR